LWDVPRYDQLAYLYQAAQFRDFSDLLAHSASWNRRFLDGDRLLYRPLLYALLAAEYGLFGIANERGAESPLAVTGGVVTATRWNVSGILAHDGRYIFWLNGAVWKRAER
jgi:hypothetical protein